MSRTMLFRTDGGSRDGLGHVMRCLTLARRFAGAGADVSFAVRPSETAAQLLKAAGFAVRFAAEESDEGAFARRLSEDLSRRPDVVIADLPADLEEEAVRAYKALGSALVLMDDHGPGQRRADLVINAIAHQDQLRGDFGMAHVYNGADYIILAPAFRGPRRAFERDDHLRLLLAMGGADPHNITAMALKSLSSAPASVDLHVLLGPAFAHHKEIYALQGTLSHSFAVSQNLSVDDLAAYVASFDLAVMSFGVTAYGAAHLGVPTVLLGHDKGNAAAADAFAKLYGCGVNLGRHDAVASETLLESVNELLGDEPRRKRMAARGREAVDGNGADRVEELIANVWGKE